MSLLPDSNWRVLTEPDYKSGAIGHYAKKANDSRVDRIRTCDNYIPNVAFYQLNYYPKYRLE